MILHSNSYGPILSDTSSIYSELIFSMLQKLLAQNILPKLAQWYLPTKEQMLQTLKIEVVVIWTAKRMVL